MINKKVIVIGSGIAGLAAAVRLRRLNFDVEIYEKNSIVGGKMSQIEEKGFKFDLGPTIVMMPHIYREIFEFCGVNPDEYIPMKRLDPIYSIYFNDGTVHRVSSELTDLIKSTEKVSYKDTSGYLKYIEDVYKRYLIAKDHFIQRSFRKRRDFYNPKTLANALKLRTFNNAYASISKYVKDEKLRQLLSFQTLYIGISPFNGPSIYTIIPMIELAYGVWFIKGGMHSMTKALEKLFIELGGKINCNAPVDEIIIEGNAIKGVKVNGELHGADYIVNTSDFPYALKELLPDNFKQGKYRKSKLEKLKYSCSCFMMYLGLDKNDFNGLNVHNLVFSNDFKGNLRDIFEGRFPTDPSIYVYAPGLLDQSLAPLGKLGLYILVPVPNLQQGEIDWNNEGELLYIKKVVYEKLKKITPLNNVEDYLLFEKLFTPKDFEFNFNSSYGATFGLRPTLLQSNYFRPQPKAMKCKGLYFAGSSNHPGAGVPIVLTSAKLAVEELLKDER